MHRPHIVKCVPPVDVPPEPPAPPPKTSDPKKVADPGLPVPKPGSPKGTPSIVTIVATFTTLRSGPFSYLRFPRAAFPTRAAQLRLPACRSDASPVNPGIVFIAFPPLIFSKAKVRLVRLSFGTTAHRSIVPSRISTESAAALVGVGCTRLPIGTGFLRQEVCSNTTL